jgi:tetratricopeptide (TPR) repeat protein
VLQRLSVFRGGFTREAAEQVARASLGVLSALVTKSLLYRTAQGRYDVHELVRQYIGRQLMEAPPDYDATYARLSRYYGDWLQRQEPLLFSAEQHATLELITAEMGNVRAALTWATTHQDWSSLDKSLGTLYFFYEMSCRLEEAITTLDQWIAALRQVDAQTAALADYQVALGYALAVLSWFCPRFGQMGRARQDLEQSLALLRAQHAPHALACALGSAGALHFLAGDFAQSRQYVRESLHLYSILERDHWVGSCHHFLSYVSLAQGRLAEARMHSNEALRLLNPTGETWATIRVQTQLAAVLSAQGALPEAERLSRETLALSRAVHDPWSEAQTLTELGGLMLRQGQPIEAQRQLRESITLFKMMGDDWSLARSLNYMGDALYAAGDGPAAWEMFRQAYRVAQQTQIAPSALYAARGLADVLAKAGAIESAFELALHVALHVAVAQNTKVLAEQCCAELESTLTPHQADAARAKAHSRSFEAAVEEILAQPPL